MPTSSTFPAFHLAVERRHLNVVGVLRHIDNGLTPTGIVQAKGDQVAHPKLTHVAERHPRGGRHVHGQFPAMEATNTPRAGAGKQTGRAGLSTTDSLLAFQSKTERQAPVSRWTWSLSLSGEYRYDLHDVHAVWAGLGVSVDADHGARLLQSASLQYAARFALRQQASSFDFLAILVGESDSKSGSITIQNSGTNSILVFDTAGQIL
jgi:hypothetical protein